MTDNGQSTDEIRASFAAGYDLERELLGGGMSRVFLANERSLGRKVVIKVLPPELAAGVNQERFRREVQLAAQLQHPHIVPLYSAGAQGELLYYTMPFIEGESLKHALQERKRFSPREVIRILHDVVDALGYAHARGVIHRDIKPGNVLMSGQHAVVTDFGVAKAISASMPAVGMTTSGMVVGSPAYMAPEQLAGDPAADHRVDLYAAGLLAYELLTGDTPFASSSPQETMAAQLTRTPPPLDSVRKDVPPALSALITKCLAKRPDERPQSAADLLAQLDAIQFASGEFSAAPSATGKWVAIAAAIVVVGGVAVWSQTHNAPVREIAVRDTVTISPAGPLLTRAESLAIARAVEARVAEQRAATRKGDSAAGRPAGATQPNGADALKKMADSIRDEIQRAVFDSLARVQQAAADGRSGRSGRGSGGRGPESTTRVYINDGRSGTGPGRFIGLAPEFDSLMRSIDQSGRAARAANALDQREFARRAATLGAARRVVITEPRLSRSMEGAAPISAALADSLRRTIGASKRFVVVPADSVAGALQKTRTIDDLSQMLGADIFASVQAFRVGGDSVRWQVTLRDLTAHSAYGLRSWVANPTPVTVMPPGLDSLLPQTVGQLNEMDRAPRRPPPPDAPGGPLSKEAFDARAANLGPARRLIVWNHPPDPQHKDIELGGTALADILRKSLSGNARYVVLPVGETMEILNKTRNRDVVARDAKAELMVTIRGSTVRDSVQYTVTAWDMGAYGPYQQRSVNAGRVAANNLTANADALSRLVAQALETLDRAPRQASTTRE
jgi:serine/threonine-protein kinase